MPFENRTHSVHVVKSTESDECIMDVESDCSFKSVTASRPFCIFVSLIDDFTHFVADRRLRLESDDGFQCLVIVDSR